MKSAAGNAQRIYRRRRMAAYCLLLASVLLIVYLFGVFGTQSSSALQGDQLGPDQEESRANYLTRAQEELALVDDDVATYALVSFDRELTAKEISTTVVPVRRLNAVVIEQSAPRAVPEPVPGEDRAAVLETLFARIDASYSGQTAISAPNAASAVLVWDDGATLRDLAQRPGITAVEPAPEDAAWGSFAVRPLGVD